METRYNTINRIENAKRYHVKYEAFPMEEVIKDIDRAIAKERSKYAKIGKK